MPLTFEAMGRLLPEGVPEFSMPERIRAQLAQIEGGERNVLGRSLLWSHYVEARYREYFEDILKHFDVYAKPDERPSLVQPSVGFFPVDRHVMTYASHRLPAVAWEIGYFFGAALYDMRWRSEPTSPFGLATRPEISVVQIPAAFVADAAPNPVNATATCWAKDASAIEGILTCKHAVAGLVRGANVAMANGTNGTLANFTSGSVDAAFIETATGFPAGVAPLGIEDNPIKGDNVDVDFSTGRVTAAQVLNGWYFPDNPDPYNPMRVFIDVWAQPGDSGSIVAMTRSGDATGIYTGRMKGNGSQQGICQYLRQAVDLLKLDLFS